MVRGLPALCRARLFLSSSNLIQIGRRVEADDHEFNIADTSPCNSTAHINSLFGDKSTCAASTHGNPRLYKRLSIFLEALFASVSLSPFVAFVMMKSALAFVFLVCLASVATAQEIRVEGSVVAQTEQSPQPQPAQSQTPTNATATGERTKSLVHVISVAAESEHSTRAAESQIECVFRCPADEDTRL